MEFATVPVQLMMICIVWSNNEDLGQLMVDLYGKFVSCWIHHMKNKPGVQIDKKAENELLSEISALSITWDSTDHLETNFSEEILKKRCTKTFEKVKDIGVLIKNHASCMSHDAYWSFIHLTLQEYFVARHFAYNSNEEDIRNLESRCTSLVGLETHLQVLQFLCGLCPERANQIMQGVVKRVVSEKECNQLIKILMELVEHYRSADDVDLPLPRHVRLRSSMKNIAVLMKSDARPRNRNLKSLELNDYVSIQTSDIDVSYVEKVKVNVGFVTTSSDSYSYLPQMKGIKDVQVYVGGKAISDEIHRCFQNMAKDQVQSLTFSYVSGNEEAARFKIPFKEFQQLSELRMEKTVDNVKEFAEETTLCSSLQTIHIRVPQLYPDELDQFRATLCLTVENFQPNYSKFEGKCETIKELSIIRLHKPSKVPTHLPWFSSPYSNLLQLLPQLVVLQIQGGLESSHLKGIVKGLKNRMLTQLGEISFGHTKAKGSRVRLAGGGKVLGDLVNLCPGLKTLELLGCALTWHDVKQVVEYMPECCQITRLRLVQRGDRRPNTEAREVTKLGGAIGELLKHMPSLGVLDIKNNKLDMRDLVPAMDNAVFSNLCVLDLGGNNCVHLSSFLPFFLFFPSVKALGVAHCSLTDVTSLSALQDFIMHLPESLRHLKIDYGPALLEVVKCKSEKEKLSKLEMLNIATDKQEERKVEAIKLELQRLHTGITIYSDIREDLYDMYRHQGPRWEQQSITTMEEVQRYPMDANPRGFCIIINNECFKNDAHDMESEFLQDRKGSAIDREKLRKVWTRLLFDVEIYDDQTDEDILAIVNDFAKMDHSRLNAFVCIVLSHGGEGTLYGSNCRQIEFRQLMEPFQTANCPTLRGKPKVFFIQACRSGEMTGAVAGPLEEDFLVSYSTVAGAPSHRDTEEGTFYVQHLTNMLSKMAHREDLLSILTGVTGTVGEIKPGSPQHKQVPTPASSLTRKLFFNVSNISSPLDTLEIDRRSVRTVKKENVPKDVRETARTLGHYLRSRIRPIVLPKPPGFQEFSNKEGHLDKVPDESHKYYEARVGEARKGDPLGEAGKRRVVLLVRETINETIILEKYFSDCHYNDKKDPKKLAFKKFY